jgi:hypothetical protein
MVMQCQGTETSAQMLYRETGDPRWLDKEYARRNTGAFMASYHAKVRREERQAADLRDRKRDKVFVYLRSILCGCRKNAAKKGVGCTLTDDELWALYKRAGGRCELTGVPFVLDRGGSSRAPYAPSIDRIDTREGYSVKNVRLTCQIANLAMNVWGAEVLRDFIQRAAAHLPSDPLPISSTPSAGRGLAASESQAGTPPAQETRAGSPCLPA